VNGTVRNSTGDTANHKSAPVVWRRLGKEHGEGEGFRVNPPEVVSAHLGGKAARFLETPSEDWRWWRISDDLIVERPFPAVGFCPETVIYYLPRRRWAVIEHASFPALGPDWPWYVHIGSTEYSPELACWVFTDLFCDVIVQDDLCTHTVLDLGDIGMAHGIGLISDEQLASVLDSTQELVDCVRAGSFPPSEMADRNALLAEMGLTSEASGCG
jgi:hypothetical protein